MADQPGNQTPNTPEVSESELRGLKVDELREEAQRAGVDGASGMKKEELVQAVAEARSGRGGGGRDAGGEDSGGAGPAAADVDRQLRRIGSRQEVHRTHEVEEFVPAEPPPPADHFLLHQRDVRRRPPEADGAEA